MKIIYDDKADEKEILNRAQNVNYDIALNNKNSLLFKGENFKVLSYLLKYYKNKIDLIYIDPPFNTCKEFYFSEDRANAVSYSKNNAIAYSDKMTKDEYLEFIRERLILLGFVHSRSISVASCKQE